jgi:hypothetical protein
MRKSFVTVGAAAAFAAAAFLMPSAAPAAPLNGAAAIGSAIGDADVASDVAYTCWRVWRCGPFGCGFRSACGWRPGFAYGRPFVYRSWAYNPYWHRRWGW